MKGFSFGQFMIEGGWGMLPVLLFSVVCLGAGVRFAVRPSRRWLAFTGAMGLTLTTAILHAMLTNVSAVLRHLENSERAPAEHLVRMLFAGLKEASRPGALGGLFLTLTALCIAVGVLRSSTSPPA